MFWGHELQDSFYMYCTSLCDCSQAPSRWARSCIYWILSAWSVKLPIMLLHEDWDGEMMSQADSQGRKEHCWNNICSLYLLQYSPSTVGYQPANARVPHNETPPSANDEQRIRSSKLSYGKTTCLYVCSGFCSKFAESRLTTYLFIFHLNSSKGGNGAKAVISSSFQQQ